MAFAKFGNNLDLRDATLANLDLSGASIAVDLQLGSQNKLVNWNTKDGQDGDLNLRNAHIGNLMDTEKAWPKKDHLVLNGATFDHLGGSAGQTEQQMLKRGADWWDKNWAELNPQYSPSPYAQLAAAFTAMGDRNNTNEIRYRAREHERKVAWDDGKWTTWLFLSALNYVAGFGIGTYTFRVLNWVIVISVLGALYLKESVKGVRDEKHGFIWCLGASLSRLLPVIEINKEFTEFFNDPKRERLTGWQSFIFSAMAIVGFVLGAILIAAVSGLTQGS
jgi:hypothetical protein